MSRVSLSFIYRPLLYNLLDNRHGKSVLFFMIPTFFVIFWVSGQSVRESNFHLEKWREKAEYINIQNYYDQFENEKREYVDAITIPSKTIETSFFAYFPKT